MEERKIFNASITYMNCLWKKDMPQYIYQKGFTGTELSLEEIVEYEQWIKTVDDRTNIPSLEGIRVSEENWNEDILFEAVMKAEELGASYVLINTENVSSERTITDALENCIDLFIDKEIKIYLENGYVVSKQNTYQCSELSEINKLKKIVMQFNRICEKECFGISINVGNANLLAKNLRTMVEDAGDLLKLIHVSDNGGFHNDRQMPYTYTRGRGDRTTDWYRLIGSLRRNHYIGHIVFDVKGTFEKSPEYLHPSYISLLASIAKEWDEVLRLEEYLNQSNKKIILFGAGGMAHCYMNVWGDRYTPAFLVDNNSSSWNTERFGIKIKSPEAILEIPEEERNVFICNQYYMPIGAQLDNMGISYKCYSDLYDI